MGINTYRFRSLWSVDVSPSIAFDVLADLGGYPSWWPEVLQAERVNDECAQLRCRSFMPYDLVFQASHSAMDQAAGLLRAQLDGDLEGHVSWEVIGQGGGTKLLFDQEVVMRKAALRRIALFAKPLMKANHEVMMRSGQRGLRAYLGASTVS